MAKKRKTEGTVGAQPPEKTIRRIKLVSRPKTERFLTKQIALKHLVKARRIIELNKIRNRKVKPMFSLLSPHPCKAKKAKARHDYFSMVASGKGARNTNKPHKDRFTVRC